MNLPRFNRLTKLFLAVMVLFSVVILAQGVTAAGDYYQDKQDAIKKGGNQESWLHEALGSNVVSAGDAIHGEIPAEVLSGATIFWQPTGALGTSTNMIAALYTPPASGVQYIAETWNDFLGKPAYAQEQGVGFLGLRPLLPIWRNFRNAIYILSSIFFIVIGVMIMLRIKISPQAVINIQNALPQLFFTLILVTFSYAIAGLIIDVSIWIQALGIMLIWPELAQSFFLKIINTLGWITGTSNLAFDYAHLVSPNFFTLQYMLAVPSLIIKLLGTSLATMLGTVIGVIAAFTPVTPLGGLAIGLGIASLGSALISLIFSIMLLVWIIKYFLGLFKVYASLIFKIIMAPVEIGMGAFPGSKMGFKSWVWDMIANIAVFPISFLFLFLATKIIVEIMIGSANTVPSTMLELLKGNLASSSLWTPSLLSAPGSPLGNIIAVGAVSIGTLMLLAQLPTAIPQYIFALKPSDWGTALGKSTGDIGFYGGAPVRGVKAGAEAMRKFKETEIPSSSEKPEGVTPVSSATSSSSNASSADIPTVAQPSTEDIDIPGESE